MHQYQIARGFDPSTRNFARCVRQNEPVYKPIQHDPDRSEEIDVIEDSFYLRPPSPPPVPYRSLIPNESDVDTDDEYDEYDDIYKHFPDFDGREWREWMAIRDGMIYYGASSPAVDDLCVQFGNLRLGQTLSVPGK
ncbi:hypothetical protein V5O48_013828 [Marasmius crinis-equi]|uniref:Uncharacterized protein n=1 Tax=Marasmius crinis-equi TaxID=585013 RepID=A0ABR3EYZ8_9AGAR